MDPKFMKVISGTSSVLLLEWSIFNEQYIEIQRFVYVITNMLSSNVNLNPISHRFAQPFRHYNKVFVWQYEDGGFKMPHIESFSTA